MKDKHVLPWKPCSFRFWSLLVFQSLTCKCYSSMHKIQWAKNQQYKGKTWNVWVGPENLKIQSKQYVCMYAYCVRAICMYVWIKEMHLSLERNLNPKWPLQRASDSHFHPFVVWRISADCCVWKVREENIEGLRFVFCFCFLFRFALLNGVGNCDEKVDFLPLMH